jgi:peptide/nickel transport system substrate-binding protein/oligopeptide transport system substrate-binding protein
VEIIQRDASSARAAVRKGEADLFLTDWYADYPDPEKFHVSAVPFAERGHGRELRLPRRPRDRQPHPGLRTTIDEAEKLRLARQVDARLHELAPWIFLWFPMDLWARNPRVEGWDIPAIFNGQRWTEARIIP